MGKSRSVEIKLLNKEYEVRIPTQKEWAKIERQLVTYYKLCVKDPSQRYKEGTIILKLLIPGLSKMLAGMKPKALDGALAEITTVYYRDIEVTLLKYWHPQSLRDIRSIMFTK